MIYKKGQLPNLHRSILSAFEDLLLRFLNDQDQNLDGVLNGGLRMDENFDAKTIEYTTNAIANTEDTVAHGLGKVPVGFLVIDINKAGIVYRSGAPTSTDLLLKCSAASTAVKLFVF